MTRCCRTCRWWDEDGAALATAVREPGTEADVGTCEVDPPQVVATFSGRVAPYFPKVHGDRVCSRWTALIDGPDEGERQGEVVPFRTAA